MNMGFVHEACWSSFTLLSEKDIDMYKVHFMVLRHDSHNNVKQSWKYSRALAGNRFRATPLQDYCSNHWAKELTLTQLSEIDNILETMRILRCVDM